MANELINLWEHGDYLKYLTPKLIPINLDKKIFLLNVFEMDGDKKKKYLRTQLVVVNGEMLTLRFSDTIHFMEELALFDTGNDQNKYLAIAEHQKSKNLKLKNVQDNIFISKSEAKAMYRLFNLSLIGYSLSTILESEAIFTLDSLDELLQQHDIFL